MEAFREAHLRQQEFFLDELANIEKKRDADRKRVESFKTLCKPLAKIFNQDENAVSDYIIWVGSDSQLAGRAGNAKFFDDANPIGFRATTARIQEFFQGLGLIESATNIAYNRPALAERARRRRDAAAAKPTPAPVAAKPAFASTQAVRKAAESASASVMYRYTFKFPAQVSEINWRDYPDVFTQDQRDGQPLRRRGRAAARPRGQFLLQFRAGQAGARARRPTSAASRARISSRRCRCPSRRNCSTTPTRCRIRARSRSREPMPRTCAKTCTSARTRWISRVST